MDDKYVRIFGVRFDNVTMSEALGRFVDFLKRGETAVIYTPNPEIILNASENNELKEALLDADLVVADGIGVLYASKIHHLGLKEKVSGIDLAEKIIHFLNNTKGSIFLLGAGKGIAETAAYKLAEKYPNIKVLGYQDGYFAEEDELKVIDKINELKPDVIFVGLGSPKQELWINKYKSILNCKVAMGVGGSIDVWAGHAKRAPKWVQNIGMEWFYRLIKEPTRIKRMASLPIFAYRVLTSRKI